MTGYVLRIWLLFIGILLLLMNFARTSEDAPSPAVPRLLACEQSIQSEYHHSGSEHAACA
jgi:hypothetical protein